MTDLLVPTRFSASKRQAATQGGGSPKKHKTLVVANSHASPGDGWIRSPPMGDPQ